MYRSPIGCGSGSKNERQREIQQHRQAAEANENERAVEQGRAAPGVQRVADKHNAPTARIEDQRKPGEIHHTPAW